MTNPYTTIPIKIATREDLRACKVHYRETWDDIIKRFIKMYKGKKK